MENDIEIVYCNYCEIKVEALVSCVYTIGEQGGMVVAKTFCTCCERLLHERIVDKNI